jgi:hypothetical protein
MKRLLYKFFDPSILILTAFFIFKLFLLLPVEIRSDHIDSIDELKYFLDEHNYKSKKILANGPHILKYYLDHKDIDSLNSLDKQNPRFYQRQSYEYINIEKKIENKIYDIIVISNNSDFNTQSYKKIVNFGYKEYKITGFNIFIK